MAESAGVAANRLKFRFLVADFATQTKLSKKDRQFSEMIFLSCIFCHQIQMFWAKYQQKWWCIALVRQKKIVCRRKLKAIAFDMEGSVRLT